MITRVVIDTNIYISAIFWGGKPRKVVDLGRGEKILIFSSLEIEKEIAEKLRTKFDGLLKGPIFPPLVGGD